MPKTVWTQKNTLGYQIVIEVEADCHGATLNMKQRPLGKHCINVCAGESLRCAVLERQPGRILTYTL